MGQLNFHNSPTSSPPPKAYDDVPALKKVIIAYKLWHEYLVHMPRLSRYTLGTKTDVLFTDLIAIILKAGYTKREQKLPILQQASNKLDNLKFFLQLIWEMKLIDNKKYTKLSSSLAEVGRIIGGWINKLPQMGESQEESYRRPGTDSSHSTDSRSS